MISKRRLLSRFLTMVRIDSPTKRERKIVEWIKKELRGIGFKPVEDRAYKRFGGEAGNVWVTVKGNARKAPRILLNAHLDTVSSAIGIKPRVKGGYVVTNGRTILGADNKAGVAVMLEVLQHLKEERVRHGEIIALFTVAEEIGLLGARHLNRKKLKADFGLTFDGGDVFEIINRAPSQINLRAEIMGVAAHAGVRPEKGINAIKVAAEAISNMKLGRIDNETTANIGMIKGGTARNIVPDHVAMLGEARSHNAKKLRRQVAHMRTRFLDSCRKSGAKIKLEILPSYSAFNIKKSSRVISLALASAKRSGIRPVLKATGGGSDANIFNSFGIPTLIVGAGADRVHTNFERLSIDQMFRSACFAVEMIKGAADAEKQVL